MNIAYRIQHKVNLITKKHAFLLICMLFIQTLIYCIILLYKFEFNSYLDVVQKICLNIVVIKNYL